MQDLSLMVIVKKLLAPSTRVVCLGVLIDTEAATISIPDTKLMHILNTVKNGIPNKCVQNDIFSHS